MAGRNITFIVIAAPWTCRVTVSSNLCETLEILLTPGVRARQTEAVSVEPTLRLADRAGDDPTLAELLRLWLARLEVSCAKEYLRTTRIAVTIALRTLGWTAPAEINEKSACEWLVGLRHAGKSPSTRRHYRDNLCRFVAWLHQAGILKTDPLAHVPRVKQTNRHPRLVPTDDEVRRLVVSLQGRKQFKDRWLVYLTAASTGLRRGSLRALRWAWVHETAQVPHILIPAEDMKSRREFVFYLAPELAAALWHHRRGAAGELVFQSVGKPSTFTADVRRAGLRLRDEAGRSFAMHSLRHYASNLRMRLGWTAQERALAADHRTLRMTTEVYTDPELAKIHSPEVLAVIEKTALFPRLLGSFPQNAIPGEGVIDAAGTSRYRDPVELIMRERHHETPVDSTARPTHGGPIGSTLTQLAWGGPSSPPGSELDQGVAQLGRASGLGPEGRGSESRHPDSLPPKTGPRATGRDIQILSAGSDHEESDDRRIRNLVQAMGLAGLLALALAFALLASRPVTERKPQYTSDVGVQP